MLLKLPLFLAVTMMVTSGAALAADPRHPVVQGYGTISPMPDAKERPDRALRYRVLFSVTKAAASSDQANPNLEKVARFLNLLGANGVRPAPGDVAVVIHGPATSLVVSDAAYAERTNRLSRHYELRAYRSGCAARRWSGTRLIRLRSIKALKLTCLR